MVDTTLQEHPHVQRRANYEAIDHANHVVDGPLAIGKVEIFDLPYAPWHPKEELDVTHTAVEAANDLSRSLNQGRFARQCEDALIVLLEDDRDKYRAKWMEARKNLRSANKGCERRAFEVQAVRAELARVYQAYDNLQKAHTDFVRYHGNHGS